MTLTEWKNAFSNNLVDILQEKGMTRSQLARDSGVSSAMISDYINKRSLPGTIAIINMAYALDIDISELIDFDDRID